MKEKKYYIDGLRILAILFVMFNHSPAYLALHTQTGIQYGLTMFLSMICKSAVPIFFMISGVLLFDKDESFSELFRKRILRILIALVLFSFLYYLKLVIRGDISFSPLNFFKEIISSPIFLPYWYLYSYLGFLVALPFLRPIARQMTRNHLILLIVLQFVLGSFFPALEHAIGQNLLCGYFNIDFLFAHTVFYPLIGYGIDRIIREEDFRGIKIALANLLLIAVAVPIGRMVYQDYLQNGTYTEYCLSYSVSIVAIVFFFNCRALFSREWMPERARQFVSFAADKVFGMYLLDGFIGTGGLMDVIFRTLSPYIGHLAGYIIEIFIVFFIRLGLVTVLKKVPVLKSFL